MKYLFIFLFLITACGKDKLTVTAKITGSGSIYGTYTKLMNSDYSTGQLSASLPQEVSMEIEVDTKASISIAAYLASEGSIKVECINNGKSIKESKSSVKFMLVTLTCDSI